MSVFLHNPNLEFIRKDFPGNFFMDGQFCNADEHGDFSYRKLIKWQLTANPQMSEKKKEDYQLAEINDTQFLQNKSDVIIWLGHASFFVRIDNVHLLLDPCFGNLPLMKRLVGTGISLDQLPRIDYVLLSHGHRDHLDKGSLKKVFKHSPECEVLCPLKMEHLLGSFNIKRVQEAGWYQRFKTNSLDIIFLPAKHWHRRGFFDFNEVLWGSFYIKGKKTRLYFAGDSGYDQHFKEIAKVLPSPDLAIMPVGAYKPEYMMKDAHMNPKEAVVATEDLKAKVLIPMHFGTYDLSDEPLSEPESYLRTLFQNAKPKLELKVLKVGENYFRN